MVNYYQMEAENSFTYSNLSHDDIFRQINSLRGHTKEIMDSNKKLQADKMQFEGVANHLEMLALEKFKFKTIEQLSECVQSHINLQTSEQQHAFMINDMLQNKAALEASIRAQMSFSLKYSNHISLKLEQLIRYILDVELFAWKRSQQLAGIGLRFEDNQLDILQQWFESVAEIMWFNFTECKIMKDLVLSQYILKHIAESAMILNELNGLMKKFTELLKFLITNSFIIEKQPPQVMKTNTRFSTKLRLLIGKKLNMGDSPMVKVTIISENQANILVNQNKLKGDGCGEISSNSGRMEYDQATSQLSITFRNMQLKKIKRAEKKGSESVVDEKFALYFSTKLSVCGEFELSVWAISLPVAVIVHGNQDPHAWATIIWDNAFALPGRRPFVVPEKVLWHKAAHALNLKFEAVTGKALSEENMLYLAEKLFRMQRTNYDNMALSWCQFSKEALAERSFTFWDWFHGIMKLTKDYLKSLWVDNTILGFIGKRKAEEILNKCDSGTFLLRFSDSELGGITVAWVGGTGDRKEVIMLQPFTAKDFAIRSLADRLNDLSHLVKLYPNIPKEEAFGSHYTPLYDLQNTAVNGYLKPVLVTQVPGWGILTSNIMNTSRMSPSCNSYPNTPTPQSMTLHDSPGDPVLIMGGPNLNYGGINDINYAELMDNNMDFVDMDVNFAVL